VGLKHLALPPFTFSVTIPAWTLLALPPLHSVESVHTDKDIYPDARKFDGFRFFKLCEKEGDDVLAVALRHQDSKFVLRTSTIICVMTIMVEVLNILQLLQWDLNKVELELVGVCCINKLIGKTKIEDALKSLDRLTEAKARRAGAQLLKVYQTTAHEFDGFRFLKLRERDGDDVLAARHAWWVTPASYPDLLL
jgi:hypothetical protein